MTEGQYAKLHQVLGKCLECATVPQIIGALTPLTERPASKVPARFSRKRQVEEFTNMIDNDIRAGKPDHLKKNKKRR